MRLPATLNTYNSDNNLLTEYLKKIFSLQMKKQFMELELIIMNPTSLSQRLVFVLKLYIKTIIINQLIVCLVNCIVKLDRLGGAFCMTVDPFDIFIRL